MAIKQHTFDGHTSGEFVTKANSAIGGDPFDFVVANNTSVNANGAATIFYSSTAALEDGMGVIIRPSASSSYLRYNETDAGTVGVLRRPLYIPKNPVGSWPLGTIRNTLDEYMGSLLVRSNGHITVDHPTTGTVSTGGFQTTPGSNYWVEFACEAGVTDGTGISRVRVLAADGTTVLHEKVNTNVNTRTSPIGSYRFGGIVTSNDIVEDSLDSVRAGVVAPGAWLGPIPVTAPTLSTIASQISEPDVTLTLTATRAPGSPQPTTWTWRHVSGPEVTLTPSGASCTFVTPSTMPPDGETLVIGVKGSTEDGTSDEVLAEIVLLPKLIWSRKAGQTNWTGASITLR